MVTVARVLPYALNIQHYSAPPPLYPVIPPPVADEHVDNTCSWVHSSVFVGPLFRVRGSTLQTHTHTRKHTQTPHHKDTRACTPVASERGAGGYIISVVLGGETLQLPVHVPEGTCGLRLKTADRTLNVLTRNTHVYSVYIPFALPFGNSPGLNVGKRLEKALDIGLF